MGTALLTEISTTVRSNLVLKSLRLAFAIGSRLAPATTVRHAARLFCTPRADARRRAHVDHGATERVLRIDGRKIVTYHWGTPGEQPYVLFAHGWSSHGARIRGWIPRLRDAGYAVVAFDQPAHGRSDGTTATLPDFFSTLLQVGGHYGRAAAVIGHSLGGAASMLALARGLQADRAILIAPAADPADATFRFARMVGLPTHLCQTVFEWFEARIGITFEEQQAHRNAPLIGCPALVVHDACDAEVPWAEGERYARCWPQARLLTTTGLGHRRILDEPSVIEASMRFLSGACVGNRVVSSPNLPFGLA